jgi:hypothetical protein
MTALHVALLDPRPLVALGDAGVTKTALRFAIDIIERGISDPSKLVSGA